jgi:hypothetical protein
LADHLRHWTRINLHCSRRYRNSSAAVGIATRPGRDNRHRPRAKAFGKLIWTISCGRYTRLESRLYGLKRTRLEVAYTRNTGCSIGALSPGGTILETRGSCHSAAAPALTAAVQTSLRCRKRKDEDRARARTSRRAPMCPLHRARRARREASSRRLQLLQGGYRPPRPP